MLNILADYILADDCQNDKAWNTCYKCGKCGRAFNEVGIIKKGSKLESKSEQRDEEE